MMMIEKARITRDIFFVPDLSLRFYAPKLFQGKERFKIWISVSVKIDTYERPASYEIRVQGLPEHIYKIDEIGRKEGRGMRGSRSTPQPSQDRRLADCKKTGIFGDQDPPVQGSRESRLFGIVA